MSLRSLLRTPGVAGPFAASMVARLPVTALVLLLVLHVEGLTGRFALAGLAGGAYALGLGLSAPVLGRLIDHHGQVRVLAPCGALVATTMTAIALLPASAPTARDPRARPGHRADHAAPGLDPARAVDGARRRRRIAATPPSRWTRPRWSCCTSSVRSRWPAGSARGRRARRSASAPPASRWAWPPTSRDRRSAPGARASATAAWLGPLAAPAVRVLLGILLLLGTGFGAVEVGVAAAATAAGHEGWAGWLLGAWGLGSMTGALWIARRPAPADPARALAVRLCALVVAHLLLVATTEPVALAPLLLLAGTTVAPALNAAFVLIGEAAPAGTVTEAFTWATFGITAGIACGSALAGAIAEGAPHGPFVVVAAAGLVATGLALVRRPSLVGGGAPVTTLVISDLHLGARDRSDVLRHDPAALDALVAALDGVQRLVLLGDLLELRQGPAREVLAAARPVLQRLGGAVGEVVVVAGNHDHGLVEGWLDALARTAPPRLAWSSASSRRAPPGSPGRWPTRSARPPASPTRGCGCATTCTRCTATTSTCTRGCRPSSASPPA